MTPRTLREPPDAFSHWAMAAMGLFHLPSRSGVSEGHDLAEGLRAPLRHEALHSRLASHVIVAVGWEGEGEGGNVCCVACFWQQQMHRHV